MTNAERGMHDRPSPHGFPEKDERSIAADATAATAPPEKASEFEEIDPSLTEDDELCNLFAAFDEVSASAELQEATLARILGAAGDTADGGAGHGRKPETARESSTGAVGASGGVAFKASAGWKPARSARRSKWRAIRVAALAACLALALTGGVAYATPATYFEVEQGDTTITLGVNCFGVAVSASANTEAGQMIVESSSLCNVSREEAVARAVQQMEAHDPTAAISMGPQGGEREIVQPRGSAQPQGQEPEPQGQEPEPQGQQGQQGQEPEPQPQGQQGQPQGQEQGQSEQRGQAQVQMQPQVQGQSSSPDQEDQPARTGQVQDQGSAQQPQGQEPQGQEPQGQEQLQDQPQEQPGSQDSSSYGQQPPGQEQGQPDLQSQQARQSGPHREP